MRAAVLSMAIAAGLALAGVLWADSSDKPADSSAATTEPAAARPAAGKQAAKGKNRPLTFTPEREAAALNFVERNHAELAELLATLKSSQPKQYEQAIKEIFRVTERLATIQERDPLHYELEVKLWTAQSRVQLLAARLKMADGDSLKGDLREALAAQLDSRMAVLKHQRSQAADRLAKMDRDIDRLEGDRQQMIERQLETLARAAGGRIGAKNAAAKQGGKRAAEKKAAQSVP
jgi:hypothetical protein